MSEQAASTTGEVKTPANKNVVTESEYLAARISQLTGATKEEAKAESTEATEDEAGKPEGAEVEEKETAQTEEAETETKAETTDVLSKIDFEKLSEAEIMELASKSRSKAIARYGELTADKKALQQQIAQLQAQLQNQKPLDVAPQVPNNIATIDKVEVLQEKLVEAKATMEWAEAKLDDAEGLGPNDTIETEHGLFTKSKLKELFRVARKTKDEWIPAQYAELNNRAKRAALRDAYSQKAKQELDWLGDEENDVKKKFDALVKSPLVEKLKKSAPEVEADLEYVLAHAVNSIHGRKYHSLTTEPEKKKGVTITPNSAVRQNAAAKSDELVSKSIRDLEQKFQTTRSEEDALALRTAQLAKRRK